MQRYSDLRRGISVQRLLDALPPGFDMLVFNAKHRAWRSKAGAMGLNVTKISREPIAREDRHNKCDIMVWRR